ncbi:unnamed protein product [Lampetra planeri]
MGGSAAVEAGRLPGSAERPRRCGTTQARNGALSSQPPELRAFAVNSFTLTCALDKGVKGKTWAAHVWLPPRRARQCGGGSRAAPWLGRAAPSLWHHMVYALKRQGRTLYGFGG